tara:strand:- start:305 stop:511 length:207 start_codon:yes stop_codon:yes gene_type:complete
MDAELKDALRFAKSLGVRQILYESQSGARVKVTFDGPNFEPVIPQKYQAEDDEGMSEEDLLFYSAGGN